MHVYALFHYVFFIVYLSAVTSALKHEHLSISSTAISATSAANSARLHIRHGCFRIARLYIVLQTCQITKS